MEKPNEGALKKKNPRRQRLERELRKNNKDAGHRGSRKKYVDSRTAPIIRECVITHRNRKRKGGKRESQERVRKTNKLRLNKGVCFRKGKKSLKLKIGTLWVVEKKGREKKKRKKRREGWKGEKDLEEKESV